MRRYVMVGDSRFVWRKNKVPIIGPVLKFATISVVNIFCVPSAVAAGVDIMVEHSRRVPSGE